MFLAHSIRLRDPWHCEATEGGTRWSRRFHRPTGLEPDDQLLLVLSGLPADVQVRVNGHAFERSAVSDQLSAGPAVLASSNQQPASPSLAQQFDLTAILADDNDIELEVPLPTSDLPSPTSPHFPYDARLAVVGHS